MENQVPNPYKGKCIASMVLGIVAVVLGFFGFTSIISLVLAIIGLVLAVNARKAMAAEGITEGKGMATAGLVLSIIGLAWGALCLVCAICALSIAGSAGLAGLASMY